MGPPNFLTGGGELGAMMRRADWSRSPLGAPSQWPNSLKTLVRVILTSRQPMFLWWGPHLINLYNDAYRSILGGKHPAALGQPASVVWREIWDQIGPRTEQALRGNEGTYDEALLLIMERNGYQEETYYTFSYSPVPGDDGTPSGIFCANTDDTPRIIGERQALLLRELAARTSEARTVAEASERAAEALRTDPRDLPFAMIFLADGERAGQGLTSPAPRALTPTAPSPTHRPGRWPKSSAARARLSLMTCPTIFPAAPGTARRNASASCPSPPLGVTVPLALSSSASILTDSTTMRIRAFSVSSRGRSPQPSPMRISYDAERRRAEALAEIDRAKTAFFSNASHEFRTSLTLMLGPVEQMLAELREQILGAQGEQISASRDDLELIRRNGLRLQKLVNTLLDFSRIEAGRVQATYEPVDLAAFTAELASTFRSAMERAGLDYNVDCPRSPNRSTSTATCGKRLFST